MKLVILIDADMKAMMESAGKYNGLPITLWARSVLLREARSVKHKISCTPKSAAEEGYKWNGKPCTQAQYEKWSAASAANEARLNAATAESSETLY